MTPTTLERLKVFFPNFNELNKNFLNLDPNQITLIFKQNSFSGLIQSLEPLILSYEEVDETDFQKTVSKMRTLYPEPSPQEEMALHFFQDRIKSKFPEVEIINKSILTLENTINELHDSRDKNPASRLENFLKAALPKGKIEKAYFLQLILHTLVAEGDALKFFFTYSKELTKFETLHQIVLQDMVEIPNENMRGYELPSDLPLGDVNRLETHPALFIYRSNDTFYISSYFRDTEFREEKQSLEIIQNFIKHPGMKQIFTCINADLEMETLYFYETKKNMSRKFLESFGPIGAKLEATHYPSFLADIAPIFYAFKEFAHEHELVCITDFDTSLKDDALLFDITKKVTYLAECQKKFYDYTNQILEQIIEEDEELFLFGMDLINTKKRVPLRSYPNVFLENPARTPPQKKNTPAIAQGKPKKQGKKKFSNKENQAPGVLPPKHETKKVEEPPIEPQFVRKVRQVRPVIQNKVQISGGFPGQIFPYERDDRIIDWDQQEFGKLFTSSFLSAKYGQLPANMQKLKHIFHAPHPFVDRLLELGITRPWYPPGAVKADKCISILAIITFADTKYKGAIEYTINKSRCYHRNFTQCLPSALGELLAKKAHAFESIKPEILGSYSSNSSTIDIDNLGNAIIHDSSRKLDIVLLNGR